MRLKLLISILLLIQALLLAHMTVLIADGQTARVTAQPGTITQVQITPTTDWGGVYGTLTNTSETTSVSVDRTTITRYDYAYHDADNECGRTELLAAITPVRAENVQPITRQAADNILGNDPDSSFSITQMFTQQEDYELAGRVVTLWSTQTHGKLTNFLQGVGQHNGTLVFVTKTTRNAQAYNGEDANYQLLLPAGAWQLTHDDTDECVLLNEYETTTTQPPNTRLAAAMPSRVCHNQTNTLYASWMQERVYCTAAEIGRDYCLPANGIDATIRLAGQQKHSQTTDETGTITFTPQRTDTYELALRGPNQTTRTQFRTEACLPPSSGETGEERMINFGAPQLRPPERTDQPREETPAETAAQARTEFTIIAVITIVVILLSLIAYYQQHKDESELLLKLRIWALENLR